ncbi:neutral amino acid transporter [Podila minutissima]|nr:neutral amino acid transporter [Podila minutissima]
MENRNFASSSEDLEANTSINDSLRTEPSTATPTSTTSDVSRSRSTRRLLNPLAVNTSTPVPEVNEEHLHAIVGQHLAVTPTVPEADDLFPISPLSNPYSPKTSPKSSPVQAFGPEASLSTSTLTPSTIIDVDHKTTASTSARPELSPKQEQLLQQQAEVLATPVLDSPSHFQLQGGDAANEVYKWHAKETRRQISRSQTYHAPSNQDPDIVQIKTPGGFRRHFIQQDAAARGEPAPELPTKSFIHFLGLFNMYEMDHFAGENFHSIPRRSIVVPRDLEKRKSMGSIASKRFLPGQHIDEDEEVIPEPEEKISFGKAIGMLFKSFIASGILFLPNAFRNGGILFAPLFMILIAVLCLHSFLLLVKCRELHPGSFGDIGGHFYGRWMRYIVLFAIAISQFGFCCGYCIFVAQQLAIVTASLGGTHLDKLVWIAIFFVILVPFTLIRNISKFGPSALIADLCIIVGLVYIYAYDIKELIINQGSPTPLQLFNKQDFGLFIGTAVFSYEGIGMVIPICSSMANPKQFPRALTIVLSTVCALLVSFGCMGYAAYGNTVEIIVLDNLPHGTSGEKAGKNAIQILYIIAIFLTTPLMLFPCIRIIEGCVFHAVGGGPRTKTRLLKENIVRILIDFAVAAVAYAGYTHLDIFISFVGSFACAPLLFIFPPMFHLRAFPEQPKWRKISDVALILFGFLVFFYTLVVTIQGFSRH